MGACFLLNVIFPGLQVHCQIHITSKLARAQNHLRNFSARSACPTFVLSLDGREARHDQNHTVHVATFSAPDCEKVGLLIAEYFPQDKLGGAETCALYLALPWEAQAKDHCKEWPNKKCQYKATLKASCYCFFFVHCTCHAISSEEKNEDQAKGHWTKGNTGKKWKKERQANTYIRKNKLPVGIEAEEEGRKTWNKDKRKSCTGGFFEPGTSRGI